MTTIPAILLARASWEHRKLLRTLRLLEEAARQFALEKDCIWHPLATAEISIVAGIGRRWAYRKNGHCPNPGLISARLRSRESMR